MAMNVSATGQGQVMVEMNTTPLIDVMLVLLTLLIITLPIQTHAVKLDMPNYRSPPGPVAEPVDLGVDFDGSITWNGLVVDRATLDSYFEDAAGKNPQPEIHVKADRLAKYDVIAKVLADAQRLGETHIGFTAIDQYSD